MKILKHPNGTVAKYDNKRAIVQSEDNEFLVVFKKLKEEEDSEIGTSVVEFNGKVMTFGFRLSKEGAIALCASLLSELLQ